MKNTGQGGGTVGLDINVEPVWQLGYTGKGIKVGILDIAVDASHPDLKDNLPAQNTINYHNESNRCSASSSAHGTNTAGIIAARDNDIGIRGIAFRATLYSYGIIKNTGKTSPAEANNIFTQIFNRPELPQIAVYNGSIGDIDHEYNRLVEKNRLAIEKALKTGFHGKGSSFVFAGGNNNNLSKVSGSINNPFLNHYAVIGVNSLFRIPRAPGPPFGTLGPNLWLVAPGMNLVTTDLPGTCGEDTGDYWKGYSATSSATPVVSGVIALLREAYPELTWRDVKLILAESARKLPAHQWYPYQTTGVFYSDAQKLQKYAEDLAFGLVDAKAALDLAKDWKLLPPMKTTIAETVTALDTSGSNDLLESSLTVSKSPLKFIESVVIEMEIQTTKAKSSLDDIDLSLVSPDNKTAVFYSKRRYGADFKEATTQLKFLANLFLGSSAVNGVWKLKIQQKNADRITQIKSWKLTIRGH